MLLVGMVLPLAARVRVQTAMSGVISTGLRPAYLYAFIDTNCANSGVTDFCERNFELKFFESGSACVCCWTH